ncbi:coagulation factor IXa isoform X1 [Xiphophorus hellerii]|uniref:coagulation factor IXa isoform X1 n=1 Tax=Xiphophorus hellerii TaxID=8084 RepID=UPI0013B39409|nr:coagulation factor IX-like isoform X1 [Xiphophorus hellerii]
MAQSVSVGFTLKVRMARVFLSLLLLDFHLGLAAPNNVLLSEKTADSFLKRHKRENTGRFEEFLPGNLERECIEEKCNLEEAREIFENDEKTMAFWSRYVDGNQCASSPCLNQGSCKDHLGYYICTCVSGFTGTNCEIVLQKRCDVNNGDCKHFCGTIGNFGAKCFCATGYELMSDGVSCEATVEFPCGKTGLTVVKPVIRSFYNPGLSDHLNATSPTNMTLTAAASTTEPDLDSYDYDDFGQNQSLSDLLLWESNHSENISLEPQIPFKRIVGGRSAAPGEIPWQVPFRRTDIRDIVASCTTFCFYPLVCSSVSFFQVGLIAKPSGQLFCGGSILSERWVITAAHCLKEASGSFSVRVGEHNTQITEGREQDYEVLEKHAHPRYNATLNTYNHDIALLYLKDPISFSAMVRPICIGPMAFIEALMKQPSPATVSGWGRTRFLGFTSNILQKIEVPFIDQTECKKSSNERITPVMFCAGFYNVAKDACQGDSGGPHAKSYRDTWFLTGIVSWGEECAKEGKYGVYTRVSVYYSWIKYVMSVTKRRLGSDVEYPDS